MAVCSLVGIRLSTEQGDEKSRFENLFPDAEFVQEPFRDADVHTRNSARVAGPGYRKSPLFGNPKVAVHSARTAVPRTFPVSEQTPEGRSTANTGLRAASIASIAFR